MTIADKTYTKNSVAFARKKSAALSLFSQPFVIGAGYIGFTFLLFLFGPIDFPPEHRLLVTGYMLLILLTMGIFYRLAIRSPSRASSFKKMKLFYIIGAIASIGLLVPSCYYYAGSMPWEILTALRNQKAVYAELADQLKYTDGQRGMIVAARSIFQPLVFSVVPMGIIYWKKLPLYMRVLFVLTVMSSLIFSVMRGTDREVADLLLVGGSALLIVFARAKVERLREGALSAVGQMNPTKRKRRRYLLSIMIGVLALAAAAAVFSGRKEDRMGTISAFCFAESGACANYNHPLVAPLNDRGRFAVTMASSYLTNGYYGLSIALGEPWEPTWGIGHSGALVHIYSQLTKSDTLHMKTYNYRNGDKGWPEDYFWSTMLTSLANDVSFPGAVVLMALFAWVWGRSWIDATVANNDCAAIVFCLAMFTIFYFPANLQILSVTESYFNVVFWLLMWGLSTKKSLRRRSS